MTDHIPAILFRDFDGDARHDILADAAVIIAVDTASDQAAIVFGGELLRGSIFPMPVVRVSLNFETERDRLCEMVATVKGRHNWTNDSE